MEDLTSDILLNPDDPNLRDGEDREDEQSEAGPGNDSPERSRRRGIRDLLNGGASIQDKILERLLKQVIQMSLDTSGTQIGADLPLPPADEPTRPPFNLATMLTNFTRFNKRIGVVFKFRSRVARLLAWKRPTQTLSLLAVYTLVCLDPYLLCVAPLLFILVGVMVPSFVARHPDPPQGGPPGTVGRAGANGGKNPADDTDGGGGGGFSHLHHSYSPRGPPLAPAHVVKPAKSLVDMRSNARDLQNSMADFTVAHDAVVAAVVPLTNFSDDARSSALFVVLSAAAAAMSVAAHLLPWRLLLLVAGWLAICGGHPAVARATRASKTRAGAGGVRQAASLLDAFVASDIVLDTAPETREVEVFELQRRSAAEADEWEAWTFSPNPYDPLSADRLAGRRAPSGTRFFEDVLPPPGWEWSEKKWALDLWSREWVEERIITGVEVETEGERWVYDMYVENEGVTGVVEQLTTTTTTAAANQPMLSWEEGLEGIGRRGDWRRRRWVRLVKRKKIVSPGG